MGGGCVWDRLGDFREWQLSNICRSTPTFVEFFEKHILFVWDDQRRVDRQTLIVMYFSHWCTLQRKWVSVAESQKGEGLEWFSFSSLYESGQSWPGQSCMRGVEGVHLSGWCMTHTCRERQQRELDSSSLCDTAMTSLLFSSPSRQWDYRFGQVWILMMNSNVVSLNGVLRRMEQLLGFDYDDCRRIRHPSESL